VRAWRFTGRGHQAGYLTGLDSRFTIKMIQSLRACTAP
jgi:hypothetical protein